MYINLYGNLNYNDNEILSLFDGEERVGNLGVGQSIGEFRLVRYAGVNPANGEFDASQHQFLINEGTLSGTALDQPVSVDFATTPATGAGEGDGSVIITSTGTTGFVNFANLPTKPSKNKVKQRGKRVPRVRRLQFVVM